MVFVVTEYLYTRLVIIPATIHNQQLGDSVCKTLFFFLFVFFYDCKWNREPRDDEESVL